MSRRKQPRRGLQKKRQIRYGVMIRRKDPVTGEEILEPYTGHAFLAPWDAQEEKWLADHDGNVYGVYIKELEYTVKGDCICGPIWK